MKQTMKFLNEELDTIKVLVFGRKSFRIEKDNFVNKYNNNPQTHLLLIYTYIHTPNNESPL